MSLQHFSDLSRQRRMVLADHRETVPDHRNDLQSAAVLRSRGNSTLVSFHSTDSLCRISCAQTTAGGGFFQSRLRQFDALCLGLLFSVVGCVTAEHRNRWLLFLPNLADA